MDRDKDHAIYVRFQRTVSAGTVMIAQRGYHGPIIAHLEWDRILTDREEHDMDSAVRLGEARRPEL